LARIFFYPQVRQEMKELRILAVLCRWKMRLACRCFKHEFLKTHQGRISLVAYVLALPALARLLSAGTHSRVPVNADQLGGSLLWGHLCLSFCLLCMLPGRLAKVFVLKGPEDPVLAHSFTLPHQAFYRLVISVFLPPVLFLISFFYVFYRNELLSVKHMSFETVVAHLLSLIGYLFAIGIPVAAGTRWLLLKPSGVARAKWFQWAFVPFVLAFAALPIVPRYLRARHPFLLEALGSSSGRALWWLQGPLAMTYALAEERYLTAGAWLIALSFAVVLAALMVRRWLQVAPGEIILDAASGSARLYRDAFARGLLRNHSFRRFQIFWLKDISLPCIRRPSKYLQVNLAIVSTLALSFSTLYFLGRKTHFRAVEATLPLYAAVLVVSAILASHRCLNTLGVEGPNFALFRPVLKTGQLFLLKLTANLIFCALHSAAYAMLVAVCSRISSGARRSLTGSLGLGLLASVVFVAAAMTLGFLLPDFKRRNPFSPGASRLAKSLYVGFCTWFAGMYLLVLFVYEEGRLPPISLWMSSLAITAVALGACSLLVFWSIRRLERNEM